MGDYFITFVDYACFLCATCTSPIQRLLINMDFMLYLVVLK